MSAPQDPLRKWQDLDAEWKRLRRIETAARAWQVARDNWTTRITEKARTALVKAGDRLAAALRGSE